MPDKRKITASCLLKVNGRALRVQLSPAAIYGGPEGTLRVRVNRVWRNGHDGTPLFVDRAGLARLLADLLHSGPSAITARPDLPNDARVNVTVWQDDEPQQLSGWTYSTPIRADDGLWYVVVSAGGRRFFARCDDVALLPPAAQPGAVRQALRRRSCRS